MNSSKKKYQPIIFSLILITGIIVGNLLSDSASKITHFQIQKNSNLSAIINLVNSEYVDSINIIDLEENAIKSILKELDPHSTYINAKKITTVNEEMEGSFGGIGVEFNIQADSIVVISPISGGPSERLGIKSGDRIVEVEDENVAGVGIDNNGVIERLRGEVNTTVNLKIKRRSENKLLEYTIKRGEIPLFSLDAKLMITNNIGYIKLNRFSGTTYNEFIQGTKELLDNGMDNLILDLRGNPGGYLGAAINISNQFLTANKLIVFTEGRKRQKKEFYSDNNGLLKNCNTIILVDEGSASASEIVAGALQDNDRAKIIGRRTFGKGLVQEQISIYDGSAVRLTTQRYYTPTGRSIQKPYKKKNSEDYFLEIYKREENDSIKQLDSLTFTTPNGNIVYGGGGITPDFFIPIDTNLNSTNLSPLFSKNWIFDFCFNYADNNRNTFSKEELLNINIYPKFIEFVNNKEPNFKFKLNLNDEVYLERQLKANIARTLWGNDSYYSILLINDKFIESAIDQF